MFPFFLALYNGSMVSIVALWATCFYFIVQILYKQRKLKSSAGKKVSSVARCGTQSSLGEF